MAKPMQLPPSTQQPMPRRREIYRYTCNDSIFATGWSYKTYPDKKFRLAAATDYDDERLSDNYLHLIELDEQVGELVRRASFPTRYPLSGLQFIPQTDPDYPELIAAATKHLCIYRYNPNAQVITHECELVSNKSNGSYALPVTSVDWNEVDIRLVGTSGIDTTCTIWDIEVGTAIGRAPHSAVRGSLVRQLIAHEKVVHDIAFSRLDNGRDLFASAGGDGSIRLFDLRDLQNSIILYEDGANRPLERVAWSRMEPTRLATFANNSNEVVVLDKRSPCHPIARFSNHRKCVNSMAWAPHSGVHICTGSDDQQALIWQMNHHNKDEPILAYTAANEIRQIHWSTSFNQWICITFGNSVEILRV